MGGLEARPRKSIGEQMLFNKWGFFLYRGCNLASRLYNRGMTNTTQENMMDDFTCQIQCDEADEPTQEDWNEYAEWCAEMDSKESEEFFEVYSE